MTVKEETLEQLDARRAKIVEKAAPLRKELDELTAEYQPKLRKLQARLRAIEEPLYDIDMQRAEFLRGRRG